MRYAPCNSKGFITGIGGNADLVDFLSSSMMSNMIIKITATHCQESIRSYAALTRVSTRRATLARFPPGRGERGGAPARRRCRVWPRTRGSLQQDNFLIFVSDVAF